MRLAGALPQQHLLSFFQVSAQCLLLQEVLPDYTRSDSPLGLSEPPGLPTVAHSEWSLTRDNLPLGAGLGVAGGQGQVSLVTTGSLAQLSTGPGLVREHVFNTQIPPKASEKPDSAGFSQCLEIPGSPQHVLVP